MIASWCLQFAKLTASWILQNKWFWGGNNISLPVLYHNTGLSEYTRILEC